MITVYLLAVIAAHPEDLMRCAVRLDDFDAGRTDFPMLADQVSQDLKWSRSYGLSVTAQLRAWSRYLADRRADRSLAPVVTLIAAASVPSTLDRGFDVGVIKHSGSEVLKRGALTHG
ncbi:MAG: hypothetical protein FJ184_01395 [Gammaproteobacteria bacterium]|nr:hypothetical protein [Gammaproteobacteria bacterium]